jgi:3-oxoacyl-[acyl-carrier protein] reductase
MIISYTDKVVIITGGTRGIGAALVQAFASASAKVIFTGKSEQGNINLADNCYYHQLDMASEDSLHRFLAIVEQLDKIDVLINNAGVNKIDAIDKISEKDWDWIQAVNLRGPFILMHAVAKAMKKKKSGKMLNISSIFGVVSKEKRASYSASKSGLLGLTRASALDLAPYNILVNSISPGFVDTDLTRKILGTKNLKELAETIPQKRLAKPDEISRVALFLCSAQNTYMTGQNIIVDGGFTNA